MKMKGLDTDRDGDGYNDAESVVDPKLLELATAGADWFCTHCGSGNKGNGSSCVQCGAPRYGEAKEDHPDFPQDRTQQPPPRSSPPRTPPPPKPPPLVDFDDSPAPAREFNFQALLAALLFVFVAIPAMYAVWWASQTHEVQGKVSSMEWSREAHIEAWTQIQKEDWRHRLTERPEIEPTNGSGERAGVEILTASCREKHYENERYACGTETESYDCSTYHTESYAATCSKTVSVACGETCRDNGNGFATCRTKYCDRRKSYDCTKTRRVRDPRTCYRDVTKYCTRPIYRDWCDYRTQAWIHARTEKAAGVGREVRWPSYDLTRLERVIKKGVYKVGWTYTDKKKESFSKEVNEAEYLSWSIDQPVYLKINNMGGVSELAASPFSR